MQYLGSSKLTIEEVLNLESGEEVNAYQFFEKPLPDLIEVRSELQKAILGFREPLFVCYYCKQKIRIRGGDFKEGRKKKDTFHFAHLKDSLECHIKTNNKLSQEEVNCIKYNGAKESFLHIKLKEQIASYLRLNQVYKNEISSVEVEVVLKGQQILKKWRRPDINAFFNERRVAIELQLSTTWLSVITDRQHFYQQEGCYILWVFHRFDIDDDSRKLTYNDVIFTNRQNAYVYDEECEWRSHLENDLVLKCHYKVYYQEGLELRDKWEMEYVILSDLTFDPIDFKVYFHDSKKQRKEIEKSIEYERNKISLFEREKAIEEKRKKDLQAKLAEQKRIEEEKVRAEAAKLKDEIIYLSRQKEYLESDKDIIIEAVKNIDKRITKRVQLIPDLASLSESLYCSIANTFYSFPIFEYYDLEAKIKGIFLGRIKNLEVDINEANKEKERLVFKETSLPKLQTISIAGTQYCILPNNEESFNKIRSNYSQIKYIPKVFAESLFAEVELKSIASEKILMEVIFKNSIYLLADSKCIFFNYLDQIAAKEAEIASLELKRRDLKFDILTQLQEWVDDELATLMADKFEKEERIKELEKKISSFEDGIEKLRKGL